MEVLNTLNPFARPVYVMVKPAGSRCNLACRYCYYLEKGNLYKDLRNTVISDELLRKFVKDYIACQTQREVLFTWHGGEPLMLPLSFSRNICLAQLIVRAVSACSRVKSSSGHQGLAFSG